MVMQDGEFFVPAEHYRSRDFAIAERDRMWTRVWQIACREEDLPKVGSQVVYDICGQSILVVRSAGDRIQAFYNSCPHRGRMLTAEDRFSREIVCPFHGWRFALDGRCKHVPWADGWGDKLDFSSIGLASVRCDTWGGFVFVNLDPDAPPLHDYLGPAKVALDPYEIDKQRWRWAATVEINCNWKLALEAFIEAYHVQTTHSQLLPYYDDRSTGNPRGMHGFLGRFSGALGLGVPSPLLNAPRPADARPLVVEYLRQQTYDVDARYSYRDLSAAARVLTEIPADASPAEISIATLKFRKEAAIAAGVGWPDITTEQMSENGGVWHLFPNAVTLIQPTGSLWYRLRPHGDGTNPERAVMEFWAMERFAPGLEPKITKQYYSDWRDFKTLPPFLAQDFNNLPYMQKGVNNRGFKGAVLQPVMEALIANYHRHIVNMIGKDN